MMLVTAIAGFVPTTVGAATITRVFDITIFPAAAIPANFQSSAFDQFDPALGTLNEITTTLSGPATWISSIGGLNILEAFLLEHSTAFDLGIGTGFPTVGGGSTPINFSLSGSNNSGLAIFVGTGTATLDLQLSSNGFSDTIATATTGLSGSITYDYTPSTQVLVPEPTSLSLLGLGLAGLGRLLKKRAA